MSLARFGPNSYPLDIDALIEGVISNGSYEAQLKTIKRKFDSFEGCLVNIKNTNEWNILLNNNIDNSRRLRFTHAHELGHFICHRRIKDRFEDSAETLNDFSDNLEKEANLFASWLLMPANLLRAEFGEHDWTTDTLKEIGNRFECSLQACAIRFIDLSSKPIAFVVSRDGMINWSCKSNEAPFMSSYMPGDELPKNSIALKGLTSDTISGSCMTSENSWCQGWHTKESQYFDNSGLGYQYTCIEFAR